MPFFSVIIATYNRAPYIAATLNSVRAQQFKDYEVIVVDDGSTDDTLEVLRAYPEVRVFAQQNKGPGAARNYGVTKSTARYIAFLDSDDVWFPWTLSCCAEAIANHGELDLVSGKLVLFWESHELEAIRHQPLRAHVFEDYYASSRNHYFVGACMMVVKKTTFEAVGGFTEKHIYAEDCDLAMRFGSVSGFVQLLAPSTLGYRQHRSNATRDHGMIFKGTMNLIGSEREGLYPGGRARRTDRFRLITLHVRPVSFACLKDGEQARAWILYWETIAWHLRLIRWKYLLGFPAFALGYALRSLLLKLATASSNRRNEPRIVT